MRALSFENLRRLVGRRKDRDEPSFERSESFKRISIRKSYLDRGKRRNRLQKVAEPDTDLDPRTRSNILSSPKNLPICRKEDEQDKKDLENTEDEKKIDSPDGTIVYDKWIHQDSSYSSRDKKIDSSVSSQIDSIHSSRDRKIQEFDSRQEFESRKKRGLPKRNNFERRRAPPPPPPRNIELSPVLIDLPHSPLSPRQKHQEEGVQEVILLTENDDGREGNTPCNCNVSVTLGRVWRDAAIPSHSFSSGQGTEGSSRDEKSRPNIARTVSAPEQNPVSKSDLPRDETRSGFSFSLSISRLTTDLRAAAVTTKNGLFRRKRSSKPALSVSTEGYFERTAVVSSVRRSGKITGSRRRTHCSRRKKIVSSPIKPVRVPGSPVWFVPPERRRSNRQKGRVWREVRYFPEDHVQGEDLKRRDLEERSNDWSSNLSDEFDDRKLLLSGDFDERVRNDDASKTNYKKSEIHNKNVDSSTISSSINSLISIASWRSDQEQPAAPKISDFNEDKIFCEGFRGEKALAKAGRGGNYFASSQFLGFVSKKDPKASTEIPFRNSVRSRYRCLSSSESETEEVVLFVDSKKDNLKLSGNESSGSDRSYSVVLVLEGQRSSVRRSIEVSGPRRRPLRRKSQLKKANCKGQPVYLARKRSSLRRRPCSKKFILQWNLIICLDIFLLLVFPQSTFNRKSFYLNFLPFKPNLIYFSL